MTIHHPKVQILLDKAQDRFLDWYNNPNTETFTVLLETICDADLNVRMERAYPEHFDAVDKYIDETTLAHGR